MIHRSRLQRVFIPAIGALLFAGSVATQSFPVGFTDTVFANTTGSGSASIPCRVWYPASQAGMNTPRVPLAGGRAAIVWLHGFSQIGSSYGPLGEHFAAAGYIVVGHETARFSRTTQEADGRALFTSIGQANATVGGLFEGAFAMNRIGVAGHSMGGGNTAEVLSQNPGYRAGVALAPVAAAGAGTVDVPMLIIHGQGDLIVPWQTGGQPLYQALQASNRRVLYLLNSDAGHNNVTGIFLFSAADREVWDRCSLVSLGFFDAELRRQTEGLEEVVGLAGRAEPRLVSIDSTVADPALWSIGAPMLGGSVRFTTWGQPGGALLLAALMPGSLQTSFGLLELDPGSLSVLASGTAGPDGLDSHSFPVPPVPALVGLSLSFQSLAATTSIPKLSGSITVTVLP